MDIKEALNKIDAGKATIKVAGNMIEVKVKRYSQETGNVSEPIKEYFNIQELKDRKASLQKKVDHITSLLGKVNL